MLVLTGIIRYREVSQRLKDHLDDPVLNGDFPILHYLSIGLSVLGIEHYHIRKYLSKIKLMPNLLCFLTTITRSFSMSSIDF